MWEDPTVLKLDELRDLTMVKRMDCMICLEHLKSMSTL